MVLLFVSNPAYPLYKWGRLAGGEAEPMPCTGSLSCLRGSICLHWESCPLSGGSRSYPAKSDPC